MIDRDEMLARATVFAMGDGVTVELVRGMDADRWAVRRMGRAVLNVDGQWEHEPLPSSRSDEFLARTRFDLETAWAMAEKAARGGGQ